MYVMRQSKIFNSVLAGDSCCMFLFTRLKVERTMCCNHMRNSIGKVHRTFIALHLKEGFSNIQNEAF